MTVPFGDRRIGYRSRRAWLWPAFWPVVFAVRCLLPLPGPLGFWGIGLALVELNAILIALRSWHGLTLAPDGINWHKYQVFVPWSNVTTVEPHTSARGSRLVVRLAEPGQALGTAPALVRPEVRANLRRFGAPIALRTARLALPPERVAELAGSYRHEYAAAGGFGATPEHAANRRRARREVSLLMGLAAVGVVVVLLGVVERGSGSGAHAGTGGGDPAAVRAGTRSGSALRFTYQRTTGSGYMDQILLITSHESSAVAPTLSIVALDGAGQVLPGVTVRTVYGSDRGMVTVPPYSTGTDVLAFYGEGAREVRDVKVTVRARARVERPAAPADELHARRFLDGVTVTWPKDFDSLVVDNPGSGPVTVRLVCVIWGSAPPGGTQQMLRSLPIGGLTPIAARSTADIKVTGAPRRLARDCGSVKVYYSR